MTRTEAAEPHPGDDDLGAGPRAPSVSSPRPDERASWARPALVVEEVPIDRLRPDPANPRRITAVVLDQLDRSFAEFGFVSPILARRADGMVIGGHQRLLVARRRGLSHVPVIWLDLSPERARVLGLALNRISGEWDDQLLARLLAELDAVPELNLAASGFLDAEIRTLLRALDARAKRERTESFDLEAALEAARRVPRTKPGELWALGDHRLGCGDATQGRDVERLLGGRKAAMAFTDPPYNVRLGHHGCRNRGARRRRITNDALGPAAWAAFCAGWAAVLLGAVDGAIYVAMSSKEWPTVARALEEAGGHWSDTIIWRKDRLVPGLADFQHQYEPIWYGWREGASHHFAGDRAQSNVWEIRRPGVSRLHPSMKPLELIEHALELNSVPGDRVLDPFAGSGSTLIACERTGRLAAILEIDPTYCDVILARWESFTGEMAQRTQ